MRVVVLGAGFGGLELTSRVSARLGDAADVVVVDGTCYLEFGRDEVAKVEVAFVNGQPPAGALVRPNTALAADKTDFGADRAMRWFGRTWRPVPD